MTSSPPEAISADGRFVQFQSSSTNLVPGGDTNGQEDIFVRDRIAGTTERVSVASDGTEANGSNLGGGSMSGDGRFVVFISDATNLVAGDTDGTRNAFVRDRTLNTTEKIPLSGETVQASISDDGQLIALTSVTGGLNHILIYNRSTDTTEQVDVSTNETPANARSMEPTISPDGRYVTFTSDASNLVAGDTNGKPDAFIRDRQAGTTERISVSSLGAEGNGNAEGPYPMSSDGRFIGFSSRATNLVSADNNAARDVFIRDRQSGTTVRVSVTSGGLEGGGYSKLKSITSDGSLILFQTSSDNLVGSGDGIVLAENPLTVP